MNFLEYEESILKESREELHVKKPTEFEDNRITPEMINKLLPLLQLPFSEEISCYLESDDTKDIEFLDYIQLKRVQEVFGYDHVKLDISENEILKEDDIYYAAVNIKLSVGNWTLYTDMNNKPKTTFISYYDITEEGYGEGSNKFIAKEIAILNGKIKIFKTMGILKEQYFNYSSDDNPDNDLNELNDNCDNDQEDVAKDNITTVELLEEPVFYANGKLYGKLVVKDLSNDRLITAIIYKESNKKENKEMHSNMISKLEMHKSDVIKGRKLDIEFEMNEYYDKIQYIIFNIRRIIKN